MILKRQYKVAHGSPSSPSSALPNFAFLIETHRETEIAATPLISMTSIFLIETKQGAAPAGNQSDPSKINRRAWPLWLSNEDGPYSTSFVPGLQNLIATLANRNH